jgi:RimJ/RimL family protein N-acetyltransferase
MLTLSQYGVTLKRVTANDIEEIRYWRNKPFIRNTMQFRKHITKKMQQEWFYSINNKYNYYFLIQYKNKNIGVINVRDVNLREMYGEGGIFIWDKNYWNTFIPSFATFILLDFIFNILQVSTKSFIRILKNNEKAIAYNKALGYVLVPYQENKQHQVYVLTKEDYNTKTKKLKKAAQIISKDFNEMQISGEISDLNIDEINNLLKQNKTKRTINKLT